MNTYEPEIDNKQCLSDNSKCRQNIRLLFPSATVMNWVFEIENCSS